MTAQEITPQLRRFVKDDLPALNNGVSAGAVAFEEFTAEVVEALEPLRSVSLSDLANLPTPDARELIHVLGFVACSIEHHTQTLKHEPGFGVGLVPGLEDALAALSIPAVLPPNLGLHGYWLSNMGDDALSFTGDPQEAFFRQMVVEINRLHEETANLLRRIAGGEVPLASEEAAELIELAAELQQAVHDCYAEFRVKGKTARFNMTIEFFRDTMRTYLVAFPVHGTTWRGPNAANIATQASLDFVIGTVEPFYMTHVAERLNYLAPEEREQVVADMRDRSLLDELLSQLEVTADEVEQSTPDELVARITAKPELLPVLQAFHRLERAAGGASGAHFALIMTYLGNADGGHDAPSLAVDPTQGTGGRSHDETKRVMKMRNAHPVARKLSTAIKAAGKAQAPTAP